MSKLSICVLFGSGGEGQVPSVQSAVSVLKSLDPRRHHLLPVCITPEGDWILYGSEDYEQLLSETWFLDPANRRVGISPEKDHCLLTYECDCVVRQRIDVAFPLLHGALESVQEQLLQAGIPSVCSDPATCEMTRNRILSKQIADKAGVATAPWLQVRCADVKLRPEWVLEELEQRLDYPMYAKNVRRIDGGKVFIATCRDQLLEGLNDLSGEEEWLLVESGVEGWEVEVAVMGNAVPVATVCAEIDVCEVTNAYIPARIPEEQQERVREAAVKLYSALGCRGVCGFSFFVRYDRGEVVFKRADPQPELSEAGVVANLFAASGFSMEQLLGELIELAMEVAQ